MSMLQLSALAFDDLDAIIGGISVPNAAAPKEDDRTWVERLTDNLRRDGLDDTIDPKMERRPCNPEMDQRILRPWNSHRSHRTSQDL